MSGQPVTHYNIGMDEELPVTQEIVDGMWNEAEVGKIRRLRICMPNDYIVNRIGPKMSQFR